jgi:hypothetical protein
MSGTVVERADLALFFELVFILFPLTLVGIPRTEDPKSVAALRMTDNQKVTLLRDAEQIPSFLTDRMFGIGYCH